MQIVIDIPEDAYTRLFDNGIQDNEIAVDDVCEMIAKGVPLSKGHGDLIDRKELLKTPMNTANCPSNYVNIAQAIIEADKENDHDVRRSY